MLWGISHQFFFFSLEKPLPDFFANMDWPVYFYQYFMLFVNLCSRVDTHTKKEKKITRRVFLFFYPRLMPRLTKFTSMPWLQQEKNIYSSLLCFIV